MMWDDITDCSYYWHVRASIDGPEEWGCRHPESESGVCNEETCPRIAHIKDCGPGCDDWKQLSDTFGYCVRHYGFRTTMDGCVVEAVR